MSRVFATKGSDFQVFLGFTFLHDPHMNGNRIVFPGARPWHLFCNNLLRLCRKMNWNVLELFKLIEKWTQGFARQKRPVLTVFAVIYINCFISQPQGGEKQWMRY
jgi:hypothetical protein